MGVALLVWSRPIEVLKHCVMLSERGGNWPRESKHPYKIQGSRA